VALERGRVAVAIAAGERSVALDPGDGEAWLILGAAYQQKGSTADARRCYRACVEAERGPKGECAAMLR
jgi:Flp pilus assembly protein TadD